MPRRMGTFDHLNKEGEFTVGISIEELARRINDMNYGTHRLLSALVRIRRTDPETKDCPEYELLTDGIEELLNAGGI